MSDHDGPELCPTTGRLVRECSCPMCVPGKAEMEQEPGEPVPSGDQPRWTVDQGPVLVWDDRVLPVPLTWPDGEIAYDALVAAVRSAAEVPALRDALNLAHATNDSLRARLAAAEAGPYCWNTGLLNSLCGCERHAEAVARARGEQPPASTQRVVDISDDDDPSDLRRLSDTGEQP